LPGALADRQQIEQVIINLVANARDSMPQGGTVRVTTSVEEFTAADHAGRAWTREGRWVALSVADQGSGIPADALPHIFEPFFTTKDLGRGTGLGLAIVYGIVEQHRGLMNVETRMGIGTTMTVYLPALASTTAFRGRTEAVVAVAPGGRETILLAEDDQFVRGLLEEMLTSCGYTVFVARDGGEADRLIEREWPNIDLAVLDVVMPNQGGRALYEALRRHSQDLPIVFISGHSFDEFRQLDLMSNATILPKPFSSATLLQNIRRMLDAPLSGSRGGEVPPAAAGR
jgi:CheY-like chemotaxis protein